MSSPLSNFSLTGETTSSVWRGSNSRPSRWQRDVPPLNYKHMYPREPHSETLGRPQFQCDPSYVPPRGNDPRLRRYQLRVLPLSLQRQCLLLVPRVGYDPTTFGLQNHCTSNCASEACSLRAGGENRTPDRLFTKQAHYHCVTQA